MDKLQWFKFYPSDWMMGKIMRCPEITQARFLRLCCLYWNKETSMSEEDARIEIDDEHFDILLKKKIILLVDGYISITFLNDQLVGIMETSKKASIAGKKSAERRKAIAEQKKTLVEQNPTTVEPLLNETPTTVQRNPTDKIRLDKIRLDKIRREEEIESLYSLYPSKTIRDGKECQTKSSAKNKKKLDSLLNSKDYTFESLKNVIEVTLKGKNKKNGIYEYLKNLEQFLNNIPDVDSSESNLLDGICKELNTTVEFVEKKAGKSKEEIERYISFLMENRHKNSSRTYESVFEETIKYYYEK